MTHTSDCPCCGHDEFFEIDTVKSPNYEFRNSMEPLGLTGRFGPTGESGFFGGKSARVIVEMCAYVCRRCRHISLFAKDTALLDAMARDGQGVRVARGLPGD